MKLVLKQHIVDSVQQIMDTFISDLTIVLERVIRQKNKKFPNETLNFIFVGGLAANSMLRERVNQTVAKYNL